MLFLVAREDEAKVAIAAAMEEWSSKTCIQFKKRTTERAYITFRYGLSGFVIKIFYLFCLAQLS